LRLGVLPSDHWLVYVTGGVALGEVDTNASFVRTPSFGTAATAAASASTTRVGWTIGAGAESVISGPWTAKVEYLYVDLGTVGNTFTGVGANTTLTSNSHVTDNIGRVGINYRFGGPVVAKY
jgi:outer membrane immunogenic protein